MGTSHALSTIAFEEAGKVALHYWSDDERVNTVGKSWSFHMKKQAAAACLLLADEAKTLIDQHPDRKGLATFERGTADEEERLRDDLAACIQSSKGNRLLELVALCAVEKTKQIGFYFDDWNVQHNFAVNEFSEGQARSSMEEARLAVRLLRSQDHLRIAQAVFRLDPLRPDYLAAGRQALLKR